MRRTWIRTPPPCKQTSRTFLRCKCKKEEKIEKKKWKIKEDYICKVKLVKDKETILKNLKIIQNQFHNSI